MAKVGVGMEEPLETDLQAPCCLVSSLPPAGSSPTALLCGYVCGLFLVKERFSPGFQGLATSEVSRAALLSVQCSVSIRGLRKGAEGGSCAHSSSRA